MSKSESYDQERRRSPKRTITLSQDNDEFVVKTLELNKNQLVSFSGAVNALLDKLRKG